MIYFRVFIFKGSDFLIKRIIFDIDMTLLDTYKDCMDTYNEMYNDENIAKLIYDILEQYAMEKHSYTKEDMTNYINERVTFNFDIDDLERICKIYRNHATLLDENIPNILDELSKEYELVTLSKWYLEDQISRLKKVDIYKYFKEVYAIENAGIKPNKEAFLIACGNNLIDECLVVGDSHKSDIDPALQYGFRAIHYDPNITQDNYNVISNLNEIKNIIKERRK